MKAFLLWTFLAVAALTGIAQAQSTIDKNAPRGSEREPLIGTWRLAWMEEPGADGKVRRTDGRKGTLVCTRDGRMSVQVMYPKPETEPGNMYAKDGYEASFGSYDVNEGTHTLTYRVEGALVRALIGKNFARVYRFSDGRLIIRSAQPDEHWSVIWEHY